MSFTMQPTYKTYVDSDKKQQTSLSFSYNFADASIQLNDVLGTVHTSSKLLIDTRSAAGVVQAPAFRSMSFKLVFQRPPVVNVQQGELYVLSRDTNFCVSFQNPSFTNTTELQYSQVSGVIPIEIVPGGTLEFQKITDNNPDDTQGISGFIIATLFTKQLPAYLNSGLLVEHT